MLLIRGESTILYSSPCGLNHGVLSRPKWPMFWTPTVSKGLLSLLFTPPYPSQGGNERMQESLGLPELVGMGKEARTHRGKNKEFLFPKCCPSILHYCLKVSPEQKTVLGLSPVPVWPFRTGVRQLSEGRDSDSISE